MSRYNPWVMDSARRMNGRRLNDSMKQTEITYLKGLKKYQERGVPIYIDGVETTEEDWAKIFEAREDGAFYMGDYVGAESGYLKEIRFDKVYNK